jgi:hypothetical protein
LILIYNGTNSNSDGGLLMRFNSDSGSNYSYVEMNGYSGGPNSTSGTTTSIISFFGSTEQTSGIANIMDYSATDKHTTAITRSGVGGGVGATRAAAYRWANTAAITSISLERSGATISTGATFNLYGVIA